MAKKNYVIDTSVFLTDAQCIYKFANNDILVPLKVLEEIDKHKKRQDETSRRSKSTYLGSLLNHCLQFRYVDSSRTLKGPKWP